MATSRKTASPSAENVARATVSYREALAALAAAAFVLKEADSVARAHLTGLTLISSRFDAVRSAYALACMDDEGGYRYESDHLTDLTGYPLRIVADCLDHGAAMPRGYEIVSRTEISPPGPAFKLLQDGVACEARNPATERVVVRVMGVKNAFRREIV